MEVISLIDAEKLDQKTSACAIMINNRYFVGIKNKRIQTAWTVHLAKRYWLGSKDLEKDFNKIIDKGKDPLIVFLTISVKKFEYNFLPLSYLKIKSAIIKETE